MLIVVDLPFVKSTGAISMNHTLLFAAFLMTTISMAAQPVISYIIPDIGTPNMNTYIEIIAPNNANGSFGADGLYLNNPTEKVRVECVNPLDTNKIVIGPIVVSWGGRLISSQIFVRIPVIEPKTEDWKLLDKEYRIPIRVFASGQYSNVDTFYIVKPYSFGDKSASSETILGEGTLGIRSRRGAMLVDRMILGDRTYTVSTADCDPWTPGNQGYLPFIVLTKGKITGTSNTIISADATNQNGGPGGGGGGGQFCDFKLTNMNGGNGYSGGGRGGRNSSGLGDAYMPATISSSGSDANGVSLNGMAGGTSPSYESAGGGSGHPFGTSGVGCATGTNCPTVGGFGGGSGRENNESGGGGGFYTQGRHSTSSSATGGNIVGNSCLVPFAGGSGGASGNPKASILQPTSCGGEGGGGGGAISLYAYSISSIQCHSVGASGGNGDNANNGGSGSGGSVILMSKYDITNCTNINVSGGNKNPSGGAGRFRYDALMDIQPPILASFAGSKYQGPTTDITTIIKRLASITISSNGQPFLIFLRPEFGQWIIIDSVIGTTGGKYTKVIDLTNTASYPQMRYYLVAMQRVMNPDVSSYTAEPILVMSQAAANILRLGNEPIINSNSRDRSLNTLVCPDDIYYDTVNVLNEGVNPLIISSANFIKNNQGFTLIKPSSFPVSILKGSPEKFIVQYTKPPIGGSFLTDTLYLVNNDPEVGKNPWKISYRGNRDTIALVFEDPSRSKVIDEYDFGKICVSPDRENEATLFLLNRSSLPISVSDINLFDQSNFSYSIATNTIQPGYSEPIKVRFKARSRMPIETKLVATLKECNYTRTLILKAEGIETQLDFVGTGQFSAVKVGDKKQVTIVLKNNGSAPASLQDFPPLPAPFKIISVKPQLPAIILPGTEVTISCEYSPTGMGDDTATLIGVSLLQDGGCRDSATILLAGKGVQSEVMLSASFIDMGIVAQCDSKLDSIKLTSLGIADLVIKNKPIITGTNAAAFTITNLTQPPTLLKTNASIVYIIKFTPSMGVSGLNTAILSIETDDPKNPIIDIPISAIQRSLQVDIPPFISLGSVPIPGNGDSIITITNTSPFDAKLIRIISSQQAATVNPTAATLAASGGSASFTITFPATSGGILRDSLKFVFDQPCKDTITCYIEVTGIETTLGFRNELNFLDVLSCRMRADSVSYSNTGLADLTINSMVIKGNDAAVFSFSSPMTSPVILAPLETRKWEVIFNPTYTTDGLKTAQVIANATVNGVNRDYITLLRGERKSIIITAPDQITFGSIESLLTATQRLTLTNTSTETVKIDTFRFSQTGTDFSANLELPRTFPLTLAPGEDATMIVKFAPLAEKTWIDTMHFSISQPCPDERLVIVTGTGLPTVRTIISLPVDTLVDPTKINYKIPIRAELSPSNLSLSKVSFTAEFEFDKRIFLPLSVNHGTMTTRIDTLREKRIVTINVDNADISKATPIIAEIIGNALLGSVESDSLTWRNFAWTAGTAAQIDALNNGYLKLTICERGGNRLISDTLRAFGIAARPQPATGELSLSVATVELGQHSVEIVNTSGQQVFHSAWEVTETNRAGIWEEIKMDSTPLPSGMYLAILHTPSKVKTTQVVIVR
ncbi:MAG: choice-of-anchor D domain-containing protein [Ignavibacteriae bacterium]|nr:choice-of-anchor D domain-containing protein [Ignavibacteriota bacterium]